LQQKHELWAGLSLFFQLAKWSKDAAAQRKGENHDKSVGESGSIGEAGGSPTEETDVCGCPLFVCPDETGLRGSCKARL
jgi:hypothetical protein